MALTDRTIRSLKPDTKPYKRFDGRGLYLLVQPSGGRYWRLKYRYGGKERLLALGVERLKGSGRREAMLTGQGRMVGPWGWSA